MAKFQALSLIKEESNPRAADPPVTPEPTRPSKPAKPVGKRQDPGYQQISAYVRRDLYDNVRHALIGMKDTDFSDLLESWMKAWLENHPPEK